MADVYSIVGQNAQKTVESTTFGTRDLVFLQIDAQTDIETNYTEPNSDFFKLIRCIQQTVEIYGVGIPNGQEVTVVVGRGTVSFGDGEEANAGGRVAALETLINADPAFASTRVFHGKMNGWGIQNDC